MVRIEVVPFEKIVVAPDEMLLRPIVKPTDKDWPFILERQKDLEENGIMYGPLCFYTGENDTYTIVDGLRRYVAALKSKNEGHPRFQSGMLITAHYDEDSDKLRDTALARALAANYHAQRTVKTNEIKALYKIAMSGQKTIPELSKVTGISEGHLVDLLKLNSLPEGIKNMIDSGKLGVTKAIALQKLPVTEIEADPQWLVKAQTESADVFSANVAARLNEIRKLAREGKESNEREFSPVKRYLNQKEAAEIFGKIEYKAKNLSGEESIEESAFVRGQYEAAKMFFNLDAESVAKQEAEFNAEVERRKTAEAARKAAREAKKTAEAIEQAKKAGFQIIGPEDTQAPEVN